MMKTRFGVETVCATSEISSNVGAISVQKFPRQPGDGQFFFTSGLLAGYLQVSDRDIEAVAGTAPFHESYKT